MIEIIWPYVLTFMLGGFIGGWIGAELAAHAAQMDKTRESQEKRGCRR